MLLLLLEAPLYWGPQVLELYLPTLFTKARTCFPIAYTVYVYHIWVMQCVITIYIESTRFEAEQAKMQLPMHVSDNSGVAATGKLFKVHLHIAAPDTYPAFSPFYTSNG